MKKLIITIVAVSLLGCSTPDPIDGLSRYINESRGLWINGLYPTIDLPVTATTSDVLDEAIKKTGFAEGHIKKYRIITTRKLILYDGNTHEYTAVMIDSDLGDKIILMRHNGGGWWTRFYNPKQWETEPGSCGYVAPLRVNAPHR